MFDVRTANLRAINSMTKYPSIPTYHALNPKNGGLLDETLPFSGQVIATEKVDGTNSRIVVLPGGGWIIGSREELLHARGDLIANPSQGIVDAIRELAECVSPFGVDVLTVFYLEVYGGRVGSAWKQYTPNSKQTGWRLFDVAVFADHAEVLSWPLEKIAAWRDRGGQQFLPEDSLQETAQDLLLPLTPRLFAVDATELPTEVEKTRAWLAERLPSTLVALDPAAGGRPEGIVLRTPDRSTIAKARFEDYARTLKRRGR